MLCYVGSMVFVRGIGMEVVLLVISVPVRIRNDELKNWVFGDFCLKMGARVLGVRFCLTICSVARKLDKGGLICFLLSGDFIYFFFVR